MDIPDSYVKLSTVETMEFELSDTFLIRRRDINIEATISNQEKELVFYYWGIPFVRNTLSPEIAERWQEERGKEPMKIRVKTVRLETILDKYLPKNQEISFLSIDAEGHDLEVLESNNWEKYRPELVIAEDDKDNIEQILNSDITVYLKEQKYKLYSWVRPSVIYENEDLLDTENT